MMLLFKTKIQILFLLKHIFILFYLLKHLIFINSKESNFALLSLLQEFILLYLTIIYTFKYFKTFTTILYNL